MPCGRRPRQPRPRHDACTRENIDRTVQTANHQRAWADAKVEQPPTPPELDARDLLQRSALARSSLREGSTHLSSGDLKQPGDERRLVPAVSAANDSNLPLPH